MVWKLFGTRTRQARYLVLKQTSWKGQNSAYQFVSFLLCFRTLIFGSLCLHFWWMIWIVSYSTYQHYSSDAIYPHQTFDFWLLQIIDSDKSYSHVYVLFSICGVSRLAPNLTNLMVKNVWKLSRVNNKLFSVTIQTAKKLEAVPNNQNSKQKALQSCDIFRWRRGLRTKWHKTTKHLLEKSH